MEKNELKELLQIGVSHGADYVELFFEDTITKIIRSLSGEITEASTTNIHGVGIRLLQGVDEVYGYTNDDSYDSVKALVTDLSTSFTGTPGTVSEFLPERTYRNNVKKQANTVNYKKRVTLLNELSLIIKSHDARIVQAVAHLLETSQKVLIVNNEGIYQHDVRNRTRVSLFGISKDEVTMQQVGDSTGKSCGFELLDKYDFKKKAVEVAERAIKMLSAKDIVSQTMPVVINNGFGGVIFHESCGHPLEASSISKGLSPFANKIGEKIASELVTAYDDGTQFGEWGYLNVDDEGHPTQRNLLIKDGILVGYLVDKKNGRRMDAPATGSSRRESYKYSPTSRMNVTYIDKGTDTLENIIKDTEYGLFAATLGGGQVDPATGEFNFAVSEGYMIEKGELTHAVRGAMLIGQGKDILLKIDRVGSELSYGQGVCGARSGSVPTDVGQPPIRVKELTVGGGGK
ncbi:MAG: TldD/PmbA family protein [Acholeplasmatales bacterium]|jgi:TldD protein|nr:TldD/PmbA family protein [Acholeplasmatales bacterium]